MNRGGWMVNLKKRGVLLLLPLLGLLFVLGCGGGGGGANTHDSISSQAVGSTIGSLNVGSVAKIDFAGNDHVDVSFQQLSGKEQFILSFDSAAKTVSNFSVSVQGALGVPPGPRNAIATSLPLLNGKDPEGGQDATAEFHEFLRELESALPPLSNPGRSSIASQEALNPVIGSQVTLKVLNSLSSSTSFTTITAEVRMITPHFIVYRDLNAAGVLSDEDLKSVLGNFDADLEYATFGNISDVDQNGRVGVVFSPVLNQIGGSGGIVTGFFFAGDLYPGQFPSSNGGEYIYCHVPDESGQWGIPVPKDFYLSNTGPLCAPHELQHAISFNQKAFVNKTPTEPAPFNEGQSHFAEDIMTRFVKASKENPSRVKLYLDSPTTSFSGGISLTQRGGSYLFYRYLYEQAEVHRFSKVAGGMDLMLKLHQSALTGLEAVEDVTGESAESLANDFFSALYLSNTALNGDTRYNFSGINLRSPQDDNRNTILSGPAIAPTSPFPLSLSIGSMSSSYTLITGDQLLAAGSSIQLQAAAQMSPGAVLIRIEDKD
ncbi:MAG: hypothetical protein U1F57_00690 [bacterium]